MKCKASAIGHGGLRDGQAMIYTAGGVLGARLTLDARLEQ